MGGDHAPVAIVAGAVQAARAHGLDILLVGPATLVERELHRLERGGGDVRVLDAPDVVAMTEAPVAALKRKPGASVRVALEAVKRGEADACFTAGHTGAAVFAAYSTFGLAPGVERPALAALIPTRRGVAVLVDAGATVDCRPRFLVQFAVLGRLFATATLGIASPRVALLSVGEEPSKGNELVREAHVLLAQGVPGFVGNLDARDLYRGEADVVVCDGFTGNVVLKASEGLVATLEDLLTAELARSWRSKLGFRLSRKALGRLRHRIDEAEYGGAPLIGVDGICIVGHGRSSPRAVRNGIGLAARFVREGWLTQVSAALSRQAPAGGLEAPVSRADAR